MKTVTVHDNINEKGKGITMKKRAIVAGHVCVDITPAITGKTCQKLTEVLSPGKLVQVGDVTVSTGGAVANTGLAMKILGADVSLMGKLGADAFGQMVLNIMKEYDAADGMVVDPEAASSYTVVVAVPGIDRVFLHNPGANNCFYASDVSEEALAKADHFHFGYPTIMESMFINEGQEMVTLMQKVKAAGLTTSLDLSAVDSETPAGKADWESILKKTLPYVDFFVPSAEELCYMLDKEKMQAWEKLAEVSGKDITEVIDIQKDIKPLAEKCLSYGARIVVIKCGAAGMYYCSGTKEQLQYLENHDLKVEDWAGREGFEPSYVPERVLSGTGAGDTSIAAFLTAMLEGYDFEQAMHLATATGALCVAQYDSLSGILPREEIKKKLESGWKKVNK